MNAGPIPWIRRVRVSNYKSIADGDVRLGPLAVLTGPNGAGKSNFLDAIAFVADAVSTTPYDAVERRGGLDGILRKLPARADSFSITLDLVIPWGPTPQQWAIGEYGFEIGRSTRRGERPTQVLQETCSLRWGTTHRQFRVDRGTVEDGRCREHQRLERDRLYLPLTGASTEFRSLLSRIRGMRFHNLDPHALRRPLPERDRPLLGEHGCHLGEVVGTLADDYPEVKHHFDGYLSSIVPGVTGFERAYSGRYVTVEMLQEAGGETIAFGPNSMSDGTIRAAGVLASVFQPSVLNGLVSLVCLEEPANGVHPDGMRAMVEALRHASERVQVIVTTQRSELLTGGEIEIDSPNMIKFVTSKDGVTSIHDASPAGATPAPVS